MFDFFALSPYIYVLMVIGAFLALLGIFRFGMFIPNKIRIVLIIIGVVLLFSPFVSLVGTTSTPAPTQSGVTNAPTVTLTAVSGVSIEATQHVILVQVVINTTSKAFVDPASGLISFHIKLLSNSVNVTFPQITLGTNPLTTNSTNSNTSYLIHQYSNGSLEAAFTTPNNEYSDTLISGQSFLVPLKAASTAQVNVTMNFNYQAFANIFDGKTTNYGQTTQTFGLNIAGQQWTIQPELLPSL